MKYTPHDYQRDLDAFLREHDCGAVILDMGLGKTVGVLTHLRRIIGRDVCKGALVVAPLRVVVSTWPDEVRKWDHLRSLDVVRIEGSPVSRTINKTKDADIVGVETIHTKPNEASLAALRSNADVYLASYDILPGLAEWIAGAKTLPFDAIIFDESSKMKNPSARRFKLCKPILARFRWRYVLTGTPAPQGYGDLWSQFYLVDGGKRLGAFVTHYRERFFDPPDRKRRWKWEIRKASIPIIEKRIADVSLCLRAVDHLDMPELRENKVPVVLPPKLRSVYEDMERNLFDALDDDEPVNVATCRDRCRQFTSGAVYTEKGGKEWQEFHDLKLEALDDIIEDANGTPVFVLYDYRHELERLRKRYPRAPWIGGGCKERDAAKAIVDWNAGKVPVLLAHPKSIGHGINLQHGGHILVWTSGTWSSEEHNQTLARLWRQGQRSRFVISHTIYCPATVDVLRAAAVRDKITTERGLIAALIEYRKAKRCAKV